MYASNVVRSCSSDTADLLERGRGLLSYVPLRDAETVAELWDKAPGSKVRCRVGGKLHPELNHPVELQATVLRRRATRGFGRAVALALQRVQLVVRHVQDRRVFRIGCSCGDRQAP